MKEYFDTWEDLAHYYNYDGIHMSLYDDKIVTSTIALELKMAKEWKVLELEVYKRKNFRISHCLKN